MTYDDVKEWCRAHGADARAILRGKDFPIRQNEEVPSSPPPIEGVFHWDLQVGDTRYPTSTSDLDKLISGKLTIEELRTGRKSPK